MNLTKARELREERARKVAEARAIYEKSGRTKEDDAKFDAIMAEADELKTKIEREERFEALEAEYRGNGAPPAGQPNAAATEVRSHVAEYRKAEKRHGIHAFTQVRVETRAAIEALHAEYWDAMKVYLQGGDAVLTPEQRSILAGGRPEFGDLGVGSVNSRLAMERRDMGTGGGNALQGTGGGYFVPVGFVDEVEDALKYYGDMMNTSTIMTTATGQPLPYPTDNDTTVMGELVGENQQVTETDVTIGAIQFGAWKYSTKMVKVSIELLQDSAFDLETFLKDKFAVRLGRILNNHFTVGTGTNQPNGILTAAVAGGLSVTATGAATNDGGAEDGSTSIGSDDFTNLEHAVDPLYRRGAIYIMNDSSLKTVKKVKDKYGRPLWLPGIAVKAPDTINGYEYSINNDMPVIAPSAKTMVFGQAKKYTIRRVKELGVLRLNERYADYGQVAFIGFSRYDGQLLDAGTHPLAYLQMAAS